MTPREHDARVAAYWAAGFLGALAVVLAAIAYDVGWERGHNARIECGGAE